MYYIICLNCLNAINTNFLQSDQNHPIFSKSLRKSLHDDMQFVFSFDDKFLDEILHVKSHSSVSVGMLTSICP